VFAVRTAGDAGVALLAAIVVGPTSVFVVSVSVSVTVYPVLESVVTVTMSLLTVHFVDPAAGVTSADNEPLVVRLIPQDPY
jgi:hypothetical protein